MVAEPCEMVDQFCEAPPMEEKVVTRGECFRCGKVVCRKCSSRRRYLPYGTVRLCNDCQVEEDGNEDTVMRRMRRMAGYGKAQEKTDAR